jgi:alpha-L-rhamnosidase
MDTSRRGFMAITGASALAAPALKAATPVALAVENLQADCLTEPRALHSEKVRLSWTLQAARRGTMQRAYRIGVASTPEGARSGHFDLWDSGRIESRQSLDIPYGGAPCPPRALLLGGDNLGRSGPHRHQRPRQLGDGPADAR